MEQTVVRSSSPFEVLALVEHTLGFRPSESAVLVSLRPPRWRTGLVARADLTDLEDPAVLELVVRHLVDDGAGRCFLALFTDEGGVTRLPRPRPGARAPRRDPATSHLRRLPGAVLAGRVQRALRSAGIEPEPWLVHRGRLRSYSCARACCPPRGLPTSEVSSTRVAAEMVLAGRAVAESRPAWEAQVRGAVRPAGAQEVAAVARRLRLLEPALRRGAAPPGERAAGGARGPGAPDAGLALTLWGALVGPGDGSRAAPDGPGSGRGAWRPDPEERIDPSAAAVLLDALARPALRDALLAVVVPEALDTGAPDTAAPNLDAPPGARRGGGPVESPADLATAVRVLQRLARLAPPGTRAAPLGCAAYLLWWSGATGAAGLHAELALADDPRHSLSGLVLQGVRLGLPSPGVQERR